MDRDRHFDVVNVVGIEFIDNGKSLRMEIVDTFPPHEVMYVTFRNAFFVKLSQIADEGYPLVVCDLSWHTIAINEQRDLLAKFDYPFFNESGACLIPGQSLIFAHMEGAIVGDIIAEEASVGSN